MPTIDGRTRHYGTFYGLPTDDPSSDPAGPVVLVHGNCQAEAIRLLLSTAPELAGRTVRMPPVFELTADDLPHLDRLLARCELLISQPIADDYRDLPLGAAQLAARLPAAARVIRWPVLYFGGFHPWQVTVRDPRDPSRDPPVVPYHDLRTLAAAADRPVTDAAYDLDALRSLAEASLAELVRREQRDCDVGVSDVLTAPEVGDMMTINHPGNRLLIELARRLQAAAGSSVTAADPGRALLGEVVAPVRPEALTALGVTGDPVTRWTVGGAVVEPELVHQVQEQWYRDNPWVLTAGLERHRDALALLGLG